MTDLLAIFGLLAVVSLLLHVVLGLLLYQQAAKIAHLGAVARALAAAVRHQTGTEVRVDTDLLGEATEAQVAEASEDVSRMPGNLSPWGVLERPVE